MCGLCDCQVPQEDSAFQELCEKYHRFERNMRFRGALIDMLFKLGISLLLRDDKSVAWNDVNEELSHAKIKDFIRQWYNIIGNKVCFVECQKENI